MTRPRLTRAFLEQAIADRRGTKWMCDQIGCGHAVIVHALKERGLPLRLPPTLSSQAPSQPVAPTVLRRSLSIQVAQ